MAKNRRRGKPSNQAADAVKKPVEETAVSSVPKFEIGVKGDEFDLKFTRAAAAKTAKADDLLRSLSKESRAFSFDLINFAVLVLAVLLFALSFALLSRDGRMPKFSLKVLADGSYTANLSEYYNETLPFRNALKTLGARLGFCDMPEPETPDEPSEDDIVPQVTEPTEPPEVTTAPTTSEAPTSAPLTEPTEAEIPDTFIMYAKGTVNIRLMPDSSSMIMGYFSINEEVDVVSLGEDGWATIWYNGVYAYVSSDYLGENIVVTTRSTTTAATTEETTEATSEETTVTEDTLDTETAVTEETTETTTAAETMDPELSRRLDRLERANRS